MALQKQGYNIKFGQGLDLKTDPNQVQAGKFLALQNAVFDTGMLVKKRNGFGLLTTLPDTTNTNLRTLNNNLVATGKNLYTYSADTSQWILQGSTKPVDLSVQALVRNASSQTIADAQLAPNGLVCSAYTDSTGTHYQIQDSITGQAVVHATAMINNTATSPRVFVLGNYFVVTYLVTIAATPHLQYVAISISNPSVVTAPTDISTLVSGLTAGYDGVVTGGTLYLAWESTAGNIRMLSISSTLVTTGSQTITGHASDLMSLTADESGSNPVIWVSFWDSSANNGYTASFNQAMFPVLAPTQIIAGVVIHQLTSKANAQILTFIYENVNTYSFSATRTDFVTKNTITQAGVLGSSSVLLRSVGIQSKMFSDSLNNYYVLLAYGQAYQPTYFLSDLSGNVIAKLAYSNGSGYTSDQVLVSVSVSGTVFSIPYLFKDLIVPVNKTQGVANVNGVYAQNGVNLAKFDLGTVHQYDVEIAGALHLTGGFLWMFDGVKPVEHSFHVWPEDIGISTNAAGGALADQQYFYQATYEWTDSQGNIHRSAPSVPVGQVTAGGGTSTNTINIPTLRLTYKTTPNAVRIVVYRWSTAQQNYYQVSSITNPLLNDPSVDSVTFVDTFSDASILGNALIYTTGGVVENIAAPAVSEIAIVGSRLIYVTSEDRNILGYSKQVIESTPVETSDLFTSFIAPTTGAQGSTGVMTAVSAMDDKTIMFKKSALYYRVGTGPDNTGANNDFSEPVFITGTVGCTNQSSIVQMPMGLMFQSDKGIWILGRDLSTKYIGAAVEAYNNITVNSALAIPGTNQVRFTLDNGTVLMYDYYYDQWGTFNGIPAISSTLQNSVHTFLNKFGQVLQEKPGTYVDNTHPVLLSYTTAWLKLAEMLQGFQRAYYIYLLSNYVTPHKLSVQIAYDYDSAQKQSSMITPTNFSTKYGNDPLYGSTPTYGGSSTVEQWRVFLQKQKCQAIQVSVSEVYDPSFAIPPGAGLTMSGFNVVIGSKGTHPRLNSSNSVG